VRPRQRLAILSHDHSRRHLVVLLFGHSERRLAILIYGRLGQRLTLIYGYRRRRLSISTVVSAICQPIAEELTRDHDDVVLEVVEECKFQSILRNQDLESLLGHLSIFSRSCW
jgi:hypothetical protein